MLGLVILTAVTGTHHTVARGRVIKAHDDHSSKWIGSKQEEEEGDKLVQLRRMCQRKIEGLVEDILMCTNSRGGGAI